MTDFDSVPDRTATSSTKWTKYGGRDIIPLWVADMDFVSPPAVLEALRARVAHGVFGYTDPPPSLTEAVRDYLNLKHGWSIQDEWIVWLPGLVQGLNLACRAVGQTGDSVLAATPVYPPFLRAPGLAHRELVTVPLVERGSAWGWDFPALERSLTSRTRLILLCNPHNPVGRAWSLEELRRLFDMAKRHDLVVCSDEIHCDLILDDTLRHIPFATVDPGYAERTITLLAPSKTWNIAGLGCSFAVIPDPGLRGGFVRSMAGLVPTVNLLGYAAAEAAYRSGGDWLRELLGYLRDSRDLLRDWFAGSRRLKLTLPEATYLAWIDARAINPENPLPIFERLGVGLSDGRDFGMPGFVRLNFGCRRGLLEEALHRLEPLR